MIEMGAISKWLWLLMLFVLWRPLRTAGLGYICTLVLFMYWPEEIVRPICDGLGLLGPEIALDGLPLVSAALGFIAGLFTTERPWRLPRSKGND